MSVNTEELSAALGRLAERDPVSSAPVDLVVGKARRARRTHTTIAIGAVTAVVLVAVGGISWTVNKDGTSGVVAADSPDMRLAAAALATAQTSYRFSLSFTIDGRDTSLAEGAYDPAGPTGYLRDTGSDQSAIEQRVIEGDWYTGTGIEGQPLSWRKMPAGFTGFALQSGTDLTVDPSELLQTYANLGTVTHTGRSGSGAAAVDTYSFSYAAPDQYNGPMSGTVEVGVNSGMIKKIIWRSQVVPRPEDGNMPAWWYTKTVEFADYGIEVHVERP
jgi:hypothetical protein